MVDLSGSKAGSYMLRLVTIQSVANALTKLYLVTLYGTQSCAAYADWGTATEGLPNEDESPTTRGCICGAFE